MFSKQDVRFPVEGGVELSAWLFVPDGRDALSFARESFARDQIVDGIGGQELDRDVAPQLPIARLHHHPTCWTEQV